MKKVLMWGAIGVGGYLLYKNFVAEPDAVDVAETLSNPQPGSRYRPQRKRVRVAPRAEPCPAGMRVNPIIGAPQRCVPIITPFTCPSGTVRVGNSCMRIRNDIMPPITTKAQQYPDYFRWIV